MHACVYMRVSQVHACYVVAISYAMCIPIHSNLLA